jgi:hypothetical protein
MACMRQQRIKVSSLHDFHLGDTNAVSIWPRLGRLEKPSWNQPFMALSKFCASVWRSLAGLMDCSEFEETQPTCKAVCWVGVQTTKGSLFVLTCALRAPVYSVAASFPCPTMSKPASFSFLSRFHSVFLEVSKLFSLKNLEWAKLSPDLDLKLWYLQKSLLCLILDHKEWILKSKGPHLLVPAWFI